MGSGVRSRKVPTDKHLKAIGKYEIGHGKKTFDDRCESRYDEYRPGNGRKGTEHTLSGLCILKTRGDRKCSHPGETHAACPISIHEKRKVKPGMVRFRGRWKKIKKEESG